MKNSSDRMERPLTTIILLNWHGTTNTLACLHSLAKLDYSNYRIIVVDNGSMDDSVARLRAEFPAQNILETGENLGFAGGCNAGIRKTLDEKPDYVWLLNNDTLVDPEALSAMVRTAESNERIGAVGSVIYDRHVHGQIQAWGGGCISFKTGRPRHLKSPGRLDYLTGTSLLLRCEALSDVGLLDENSFFMYWEDVDICFRLRKGGWSLAVAKHSRVRHEEGASTGKGSCLLELYLNRSAVHFFRKYCLLWGWPVAIRAGGRTAKRLLMGEWRRARAILNGTLQGICK